jgi:pSer/pThr/pTyr-binding forkhead associated (FHA) protein
MDSALVMYRPGGENRVFKLSRDVTVIGRREDCDLRIPLGEISRKHCKIIRSGDSFLVEDMGSSNGTYVNGRRVQSLDLDAGDTVQVGPVVFVLQIAGEPAADAIAPITAGHIRESAQHDSGSSSDAVTSSPEEIEELTHESVAPLKRPA